MDQDRESETTDVAEVQKDIAERQLEVERVQQLIAQVRADKDAAHRTCSAGIAAAKTQIDRLKQEIAFTRQLQAKIVDAQFQEDEAFPAEGSSPLGEPKSPMEEEMQVQSHFTLRMESRKLRHELSKLRHQAETLEAERPNQSDEITRLRVEHQHIHEVLESTRHAVRHHQVDQTESPSRSSTSKVKLFSGGHSRVEALAEKGIREHTERRNEDMLAKARQLNSIVGAQQLLIQRLEKQLLFEESILVRKNAKLADESTRQKGLKTVMRRCSDETVSMALCGDVMPPARKKKPMSKQKTASGYYYDEPQATGMPRTESVPSLPRMR